MKTCSRSEGARERGRTSKAVSHSPTPSPTRTQQPVVQGKSRGGDWRPLLIAVFVSGLLSGCAFYSFSGASIPSHLNTIAIPLADDNTSNPVPSLGRDLTSLLTDQFVGRTRLSLNNNESDADAVLTTRITGYSNQPSGVSGQERATTNTVRVRVDVRYYDQIEDSTMVDQSFTGSADYDPVEAGLDGERQAAQLALERVSEDIFTTATSNW